MRVELYGGFMDGQTYQISSHMQEIRVPWQPVISLMTEEENDLMPNSTPIAIYEYFALGKYRFKAFEKELG